MDSDDNASYERLLTMSRELAARGKVTEALDKCRQAYRIYPTEKLQRKIDKMEAYLAENGSDTEDEKDDNKGLLPFGDGFFLHRDLADKLYDHQRKGVLWMWKLHVLRKGGILGDDMGLGKTIQVIAFLSGLFDLGKIKHVLIVMPLSVIPNWERELEKWAPGIQVSLFHGAKRERQKVLTKFMRREGVCLSSYGTVSTSWEDLSACNGRTFVWDYVILDEGHKIKNTNKTSKSLHAVSAKHRLILTGTPIQNNLKELWSLFDFVHFGSLLGTQKTFKMEYETPIYTGREKDASAPQKRLGMEMSESLRKIIAPYFLARTKAEVRAAERTNNNAEILQMPTLSRKNDLVVWMYLSETQIKIYREFLQLESVKELLMMTNKSPLVALTVLKKICDHPRLLSKMACKEMDLYTDHDDDDKDDRNQVANIPVDILIKESGKLKFLVDLLEHLRDNQHRALIFSQSRKMLDIIYKVLDTKNFRQMRLDGTVKHLHEREQLVQKFQHDASVDVFLLTTQVGGVGLTLTGADRVIIFDPSWNPATDAQAVDRAFRIGQQKNVVIYRLISCGTVEEKIYRRQIFKDSITKQTTGGGKDPYRYFTRQDLRELFEIGDPHDSSTQRQLEEMHSQHRMTDPDLDGHLAYLHSIGIFGLSDHDLMFSKEIRDHEATALVDDAIQAQVQRAQGLIMLESQQALGQPASRPMDYVAPVRRPRDDDVPTSGLSVRPSDFKHARTEPVIIKEDDYDDDDDDDDVCAELEASMDDLHLERKCPRKLIEVISSDDDVDNDVSGGRGDAACLDITDVKASPDSMSRNTKPTISVKREAGDWIQILNSDTGVKREVKRENEVDIGSKRETGADVKQKIKLEKELESKIENEVVMGRKCGIGADVKQEIKLENEMFLGRKRASGAKMAEAASSEEKMNINSDLDDVEDVDSDDESPIKMKRIKQRVVIHSDTDTDSSDADVRRETDADVRRETDAYVRRETDAYVRRETDADVRRETDAVVRREFVNRTPGGVMTPNRLFGTPAGRQVVCSGGSKQCTPSRREMDWMVDDSEDEEQVQAELSSIMIEHEAGEEDMVVDESFRAQSRNLFESSDAFSVTPTSRDVSIRDRSSLEASEVTSVAARNTFATIHEKIAPDQSTNDHEVDSRHVSGLQNLDKTSESNDHNHNAVNEGMKSQARNDREDESEESSVGPETENESVDDAKVNDQPQKLVPETREHQVMGENQIATRASDESEEGETGEEEEDENERDHTRDENKETEDEGEDEETDDDEEEESESETKERIRQYKLRARQSVDERDYIRAYKYTYAALKLDPTDDQLRKLLQALRQRIKKLEQS